MTDCKVILDKMLDASLDELDSDISGLIGDHLADCPTCAAAAERIVAVTRALASRRARETGALDLEGLLARAAAEGEGPGGWRGGWRGSGSGSASGPPTRRRPVGVTPWLGLAAAAVLATVLLRPSPPLPSNGPITRPPAEPPLVEAAPGQDVVVLPTRNPDITLVWLYTSEESAP